MKNRFLIFGLIISTSVCFAQPMKIVVPQKTIPQSLVGDYAGAVYLTYYIDFSGNLWGWDVYSIRIWDDKIHQFISLYHTNPARYSWKKEKGRYERETITDLKFKNTRLGMEQLHKLAPWLEQYVNETKIEAPAKAGNDKDIASQTLAHTEILPFNEEKLNKKMQPYLEKRGLREPTRW